MAIKYCIKWSLKVLGQITSVFVNRLFRSIRPSKPKWTTRPPVLIDGHRELEEPAESAVFF